MKIAHPNPLESLPTARTPRPQTGKTQGTPPPPKASAPDRLDVSPEAAAARSIEENARRTTRELVAETNRGALWTPGRDLREVTSLLRSRAIPT